MTHDFAGRKLLLIGGGGGIGAQMAADLLERGAQVVVVGRSAAKLQALADAVAAPDRLAAITADITTPAGFATVTDALHGPHRDVDLFVNAAGVFVPKPFLAHEPADYDARAVAAAQDAGYACAVVAHGEPLHSGADLFRLERLPAVADPTQFRSTVNGLELLANRYRAWRHAATC